MTDIDGKRVLVAGASGMLGGRIGDALHARGARVVAAGRDGRRTSERAAAWSTEPVPLDVVDEKSCRTAVEIAVAQLGGLDGVVVAVGVPAFGPAAEADPAVVEEVFAVNALGPMTLVRTAVPHLPDDGFVVVLSAILASAPMAGMADYSAAKAALAAWLQAGRREWRPRTVVDVRPPHLESEFATRALAGDPPALPAGLDPDRVVAATLEAVEGGKREVSWDPRARDLRVD